MAPDEAAMTLAWALAIEPLVMVPPAMAAHLLLIWRAVRLAGPRFRCSGD